MARTASMARWLAGFVSAAALLGASAPTALAEDKPTGKALEFQKALEEHLVARDTAALTSDVQAIAKYAAQASDAAERSHLLNLVGRAAAVNDDPLRIACLKAFQDMKDPVAWKYFRDLVVQPDSKRMEAVLAEAINTCGVLTPEGAVLPLIRILNVSDALPACVACLKALSKFKNSPQRSQVLFAMIDEVRSVKPGAKGRTFAVSYGAKRTGEAAATRYEALQGPAVEAANTITGQSIGTADDWIKTITDMKSTLEDCFMEPIVKKKP